MLIVMFILLFWVATRTGLYASVLKNTSVCSHRPQYPALSDWSAHTRLSLHSSPRLPEAVSLSASS